MLPSRFFGSLLWVLLGTLGSACGARGELRVDPPPIDAGGVDAGSARGAYDLDVGPVFAALTTADGRYFEWSVQVDVGEARFIPDVPPALRVVVGRGHRCILDEEGRVLCWGRSADLAIGQGLVSDVEQPSEVPLPAPAVDLSASTQTTCAVLSDQQTWCWGANRYRQLGAGDGREGPSGSPLRVEIDATAQRVVAAPTHACALLNRGEVRCWGAHRHSQLGDGAHTTSFGMEAVVPDGIGPSATLAVGLEWSCVLTIDEGTWCWGEPASAPHRALFAQRPTLVRTPPRPQVVSLGDDGHACFLAAGAVSCFAYDDADPMPASASAVPVPGLADDVVDLDVGYWQACALHADGGVSCWPASGRAERVRGLD